MHIELPEDIAGEEVDEAHSIVDLKVQKIRRPVPDEKAIQNLVKELEKAKSPVLLIGAGANRKRVTKYLTKFIEKHNIPYFTSQMGK